MTQLVAQMKFLREPPPQLIAMAERENAQQLVARGATLDLQHGAPERVVEDRMPPYIYWLLESTAWVEEGHD